MDESGNSSELVDTEALRLIDTHSGREQLATTAYPIPPRGDSQEPQGHRGILRQLFRLEMTRRHL